MALSFTPKSEKDLKTSQLAPEGTYDFDVLESRDRLSKSGNAMIEVKLGIYTGERITHHVYDYLLPQMEAKLRHFCDSAGLLTKYESASLEAADCKGRSGKCRIVQTQDAGYDPKNTVKDYVCRKAKPLEADGGEPDDVPF
jgi:hypothetical protein